MRSVLFLLLALSLPAHADELQDRIESAIKAFGELVPHAPDVGLIWADVLISDAIKQANPSEQVKTTEIGKWLVANQPMLDTGALATQKALRNEEENNLRKQRAEWLASAFKHVMKPNTVYDTALASQTIGVEELRLRIDTALDKVTPGPTKEEIQAAAELRGRILAKDLRESKIVQEYAQHFGEGGVPKGLDSGGVAK